MNCPSSGSMPTRTILQVSRIPPLEVQLARKRLGRKESPTKTLHCDAIVPRGVSSVGEPWPTTSRSDRLRKRRTRASRKRRFSINKKARMDELRTQSVIIDLTSKENIPQKSQRNEAQVKEHCPVRVSFILPKCQLIVVIHISTKMKRVQYLI